MARQLKPTVLGIDGGGSRTRGVLFQGSTELAYAETGTARVGTVGVVESAERILNLIDELCRKAGVENREIDSACIGLAGVWLKQEQQRTEQLIHFFARERKILLEQLRVTSDAAIALEGALGGDPGIVLIVGTGTIAIGKTSDDEIVRCSGWGIELSDEGSGAWIGREALKAMVRSYDGRGEKTSFANIITELFPAVNPDEPRTLVAAFNERIFEYGTVAPMVMQCATEGDAVCSDIIDQAVVHLEENVSVLRQRYFEGKNVKVACLGGIMESENILSRKLRERLEGRYKVVAPEKTAIYGAVDIAQSM